MKQKLNLSFLLLYFFVAFKVEAQNKFMSAFGDTLSEYCFSVQQTADKGFVMAGYSSSYGPGSNNFYVVKTDSVSNIVWSKVYEGALDDELFGILQTTDGGYIATGYTRSFGVQYYDAILIKLNSNGDTLWSKTYGGLGSDYGNTVTQTADGGFIMAGYTTKSTIVGDTGSIYIVKTDAMGNMQWQKLLGMGSELTDAYSIKQTADKGYVITGYGNGFGDINGDMFLIKTDSMATPQFTKTYGYKGADWGNSLCLTNDGGYIIAGTYSTDSTSLDLDGFVVKTDANGDTLWTRTFGGNNQDYIQYVSKTNDGGYILGGYTNSFGAGSYDAFLIKLNATGDTLWSKTFGNTRDDEANAVIQTNDGGYVLAGQTNSFGKGVYDFYLIKTDAQGNSFCNETNVHAPKRAVHTNVASVTMLQNSVGNSQLQAHPNLYTGATLTDACNLVGIGTVLDTYTDIKLFPNPSTGLFTVALTNEGNAKLVVRNMLGEIVYSDNFYLTNGTQINLQNLVTGTYFIQMQNATVTLNQKIVIVK